MMAILEGAFQLRACSYERSLILDAFPDRRQSGPSVPFIRRPWFSAKTTSVPGAPEGQRHVARGQSEAATPGPKSKDSPSPEGAAEELPIMQSSLRQHSAHTSYEAVQEPGDLQVGKRSSGRD